MSAAKPYPKHKHVVMNPLHDLHKTSSIQHRLQTLETTQVAQTPLPYTSDGEEGEKHMLPESTIQAELMISFISLYVVRWRS